jgi:hypothetical protein
MVRLVYTAPEREPWTDDRILDLWCWALDGLSLVELGEKVRASSRECDLALWALLGREASEAASIMNGRRP